MEKLLPNGSIVLLKGGNKKLMIYGRKQIILEDGTGELPEEGKMYDYIGVFYPEGYISPEYTFAFNHADIQEVIFTGYTNEEEEEFQEVLKQV